MRSDLRVRQPVSPGRAVLLVLGFLLLVPGGVVVVLCVAGAALLVWDGSSCVNECWGHGIGLIYAGLVGAAGLVVGLLGGLVVLLAWPRRVAPAVAGRPVT